MRRLFMTIGIALLCCCFSSCGFFGNKGNNGGVVSIKPEGDVFIYVDKMFSGDIVKDNEEINIKITYGCNLSNDMISKGTDARFVITSDQVDIKCSPIVYEDILDGKCARDKELTYIFSFPTDSMLCNAGSVKFEIQLLDESGEIISFCNKNLYFAAKNGKINLGVTCMQEAVDYLSDGYDIYFNSVQGADAYTQCFWCDESEGALYLFSDVEGDLILEQYSYEKCGNDILVKDKEGQVLFTIEYIEKDKMKVNDEIFYCLDEDLW